MNQCFAVITLVGAIAIGGAGYGLGTELAGGTESAPAVEAPLPAPAEKLAQAAPATPINPETLAAGSLSDDQRAEVESIIRGYLLAHPEIIRDAINELQRRQDAAEQAQQVAAITDNKDLLFDSTRQVVLGNPKGDATLVEFFDFNCGYCKRAHADMKQLIAEDKNLRIVLKEFPVLGEGSVQAAQVGIAIALTTPERYWEFFDAMLTERGQVNLDRALAVAEEIGLDRAKIEETMSGDEVKSTITEAYDLANKLGLTGTPSYVTAKEVVIGAVGLDALREKINQARCGQAVC